ncbi:MAG: SH3 domain-containing protein [Chloroflexi bacterium]|nr:SH3 domain-containing protein [Chloroflexota bacterium]
MTVKRLGLALVMVLIVVLAVAVQAQDTPPPATIQFALDALGEQVGREVTLADITRYQWNGQLYPDSSLGCPQEGQSYTQAVTRGVQYLLTYRGTVYDYRVSNDGGIVILCESTPLEQAESTAEATAEATAAAAAATCGEPLDFSVGQTVNVVSFIGNLNVREQPALTATRIGQVSGGDSVTIVGGPECGARGLLWWQVQAGDLTGWVAEGRGSLYFLEAPEAEATATAAPGG